MTAGALALLLLAAPLKPIVSTPLTAPAPLNVDVPLVAGGQPKAVLAVPEVADYAALADPIAARLKAVLGVDLPRVPEAELKADGRTWILWGNLFCGPRSRRLYANKRILADGLFPGRGYELRTVVNPADFGAPVLYLGGSTPEGVRQALDALAGKLQSGPEVSVARLTEVRSIPDLRPKPPTDDDIARQVAEVNAHFKSFTWIKLYLPIQRMRDAATGYLLTGDDAFGRLYAKLLEATVAYWDSTHPEPPTFVIPSYVTSLAAIEPSAGMTDADRLRGAEWCRQVGEATMKYWEMYVPIRRYQQQVHGPIWNHETHPALGMAHVSQYLRARYGLPAADWWDAVTDYLFAQQAELAQPLEDSADYQWIVHHQTAEYALVTGRLSNFFTGGAFRRHLAYAIDSHDNLGYEATHGDAWDTFASIAGPSFLIGQAVYRDPAYGYLLDLLGRPTPGQLWSYAGPSDAKEPTDRVGLMVHTVDGPRAEAYGITGLAPDRTLDKAVFRTDWSRNGAYLMLDGLNVGNHKHVDANAIIAFVDLRRRWLTDMDYVRAAPKHHNALLITRDGVQPDQRPTGKGDAQVIAAPPLAAELTGQASGDGLAITQSVLHDDGGADWRRSLFWAGHDGFAVVDDVTALQEGDYALRCRWRTLGEVSLRGSRVEVKQRGEHSYGSREFELTEDAGRPVALFKAQDAQVVLEPKLPAGQLKVDVLAKGKDGGSDSFWLRLDDQPPVPVWLAQDSYGDEAGKSAAQAVVQVPAAGTHHLLLTLRESPGPKLAAIILRLPDGTTQRLTPEQLVGDQVKRIDEPEQFLSIANAEGSGETLTQQLDRGHGGPNGYYVDYPYAGPVTQVVTQVQQNRLRMGQTATFANLFTRGQGTADPRELRAVAPGVWVAGGPNPLLVATAAWQGQGIELPGGAVLVTPRALVATGTGRLAIGSVACQLTGTSSHQAFDAAASATVRQQLTALYQQAAPAPAPRTIHPLSVPGVELRKLLTRPAPIIALAAAGDTIVTGDGSGKVTALDAEGKVQWTWDADDHSPVTAVAPIRRADGVGWAVGTRAGDVDLLSPAGARRWRYRCEPYEGQPGEVATIFGADLDGDGQQEVVAGARNWHYHALAADGKLLWRRVTTHASTVGTAADLTGDNKDEVIAGTEYYWPKILGPDGKELVSLDAGPVTSAVAAGDLNGDGKREALIGEEDGWVRAVGADKKVLWQVNAGGPPTGIVVWTGAQGPRLAVASEGHGLAVFNGAGERLRWTALPLPARGLAKVDDRLVIPCDDGTVYLANLDGELVGGAALPAAPGPLAALAGKRAVVACENWLAVVGTDG